jgi:hypothetical protein
MGVANRFAIFLHPCKPVDIAEPDNFLVVLLELLICKELALVNIEFIFIGFGPHEGAVTDGCAGGLVHLLN